MDVDPQIKPASTVSLPVREEEKRRLMVEELGVQQWLATTNAGETTGGPPTGGPETTAGLA